MRWGDETDRYCVWIGLEGVMGKGGYDLGGIETSYAVLPGEGLIQRC